MLYVLAMLLLITLPTECMELNKGKQKKSEEDNGLTSLFSNLFPGTEDENISTSCKKLPLKKITIEKEMVPLLEQSRLAVPQEIQKEIEFITSNLAQKKLLEIITPLMLIFGEPGTGKSTLALSIAQLMQQQADWTIYRLKSIALATQFQNSGPQNLEAIAEKILNRKKGTTLIVEDMNGFYPQYQSGDTTDSGSNAIAWWQFLDKVQDNPQKHVLVIATESNTDMPNQIKERLGHTMIALKSLTQNQITRYLEFVLKKHSSIRVSCNHNSCETCYAETLKRCVQKLSSLPDISYSMLEGFIQQVVRVSVSGAFKRGGGYSFLLSNLESLIKNPQESTEYKILKMNEEYESEQERLHKKQMAQSKKIHEEQQSTQEQLRKKQLAQQKQLHEEQQGLALLQLRYQYNYAQQQLAFSAATDRGGLPNYGAENPKELLDTEQYQFFEAIFTQGKSNTTPLLPTAINNTENTRIMETIIKKLKKL